MTTKTSADPIKQNLEAFARHHKTAARAITQRNECYSLLVRQIQSLRMKQNMPVRQLAEAAGVSPTSLINWLYNGLKTMKPSQARSLLKILSQTPAPDGQTTQNVGT